MRALALLIGLALVSAACDDAPTSPDPPSAPVSITEAFTGTLPVLDARFYSFVVLQGGTVNVMLGSLTASGSDTALQAPVTVGLGIPQGTGCDIVVSVATGPGLVYALSVTLGPGTYCADIRDTGSLPGPADFAVRIVQHPSEPIQPAPGTSVLESDLTIGGAATRTFQASREGTVTLQLLSVGPPEGVAVNIGLGIPRGDGSGGCHLAVSLTTAAPAELSTNAVPGVYCAKVSDVGGFTGTARFRIHIVHP